jgi:hypothetical protein
MKHIHLMTQKPSCSLWPKLEVRAEPIVSRDLVRRCIRRVQARWRYVTLRINRLTVHAAEIEGGGEGHAQDVGGLLAAGIAAWA